MDDDEEQTLEITKLINTIKKFLQSIDKETDIEYLDNEINTVLKKIENTIPNASSSIKVHLSVLKEVFLRAVTDSIEDYKSTIKTSVYYY